MKYPITYQYINALLGAVFADVRTDGKALSAGLENEIKKIVVSDVVLQPNSSIDEVYTYYTEFDCRDEKTGTPSMPVSFFARCSRVKESVQVAKNTQCVGWSWNAIMLKDSFCESVLQTKFYSDIEISSFRDRKAPAINESVSLVPLSAEEISERAIKAVFFGMMARWKKGGKPICVAVPEGKNYIEYVLSAVAAIYAYFPTRMRAEFGFSSYQTREERMSSRKRSIYLCFVPAEESDSDTIFLDGKTSTAGIDAYINRGTDNSRLDSFVDYMCKLGTVERESLIADIYEIIEGGDSATPDQINEFSVFQYGELAEAIKLQDKVGPLTELLPAWEQFYVHPEKYPVSMIERLKQHIHKQMSVDDFKQHIKTTLDDENSENIFAFFKGIIRFLSDRDNREYSEAANVGIMELLDNRLKLSASDKFEALRNNQTELRSIISRDDVANAAAVCFMQQLEELKDEKDSVVFNTAEEYVPFIESVKGILHDCDGLVNTAALLECIGQVKTFRRQLVDEQNSKASKSDIEKREALEIEGYFDFLEKYHAFSVKYTHDEYLLKSLDELETHRQAELEKLNFEQYCSLYQKKFGAPISRDSLAEVGAAQLILEDLRRYDEDAFIVDTEGRADYIYAQIQRKLALLKFIHGEERMLKQRIAGYCLTGEKALDILSLNSTTLEKSDFEIISELVKAGSYKVKDTVKLLSIYKTLEASSNDYIQLIAAVEDDFEVADDSEYEQSASCIYLAMLSNCGLSADELSDILAENIRTRHGKDKPESLNGLSKWLWIIVNNNLQAKQKDDDFAELQETKGRLEADLIGLQENYSKLFDENQQLEIRKQTLYDENSQLTEDIKDRDRTLSILNSEKAQLESDKQQLETKRDEMAKVIQSLKVRAETLTAEKTRLENDKGWLESEKSRLESDKKELEAKEKDLMEKIGTIEKRAEDLSSDKSRLEGEKTQLESEKQQLETEQCTLTEKITKLTEELSSVKEAKVYVEKEKASLERKISEADKHLERIRKEADEGHRHIEELTTKLSDMKTARIDSEKRAEELYKNLESMKADRIKLQSDNSNLKIKLKEQTAGNRGSNLKYIIPLVILGIALILTGLFGLMQRNRNVELTKQNELMVAAIDKQKRMTTEMEENLVEVQENLENTRLELEKMAAAKARTEDSEEGFAVEKHRTDGETSEEGEPQSEAENLGENTNAEP